MVVLPDGTRTDVPDWMTHVDAQSGSELVPSPTVAVSALRALKRLLDAQEDRDEPSSADFDDPTVPASGDSP